MNDELVLFRVTVSYKLKTTDCIDIYVIAGSKDEVIRKVTQYIKDTYISPDNWIIGATKEIARVVDTDIYV